MGRWVGWAQSPRKWGCSCLRADRPAISLRLAQEGEKMISKAQEKQGRPWDPELLAASSSDLRETPPPEPQLPQFGNEVLDGSQCSCGHRLLW